MSGTILSTGIHGATGRMGTRLIQLIAVDPTLKLGAALVREGHAALGRDAFVAAGLGPGGAVLTQDLPAEAVVDVMIDFSLPPAVHRITACCLRRKIPLVVGTTGLSAADRGELELAAAEIPILVAPNMSRAVNLLMKLVHEAARSLGRSADIAIVERHHRTKKDAPSGTALRLAEFAREGQKASAVAPGGAGHENGDKTREIDIHALRSADCPGEHLVVFGLPGETLELSHRAQNRDGFARGALDAARFLAGKPAGMYTMADVVRC